MKILFVANRVPYPPYRGDKLKIYNLAKQLHGKHELHLITFAQTKEDLGYKAELEKYFAQVEFIYLPLWQSVLQCILGIFSKIPFQVLYFRSAAFRKALNKRLANQTYDVLHVQHLRMAQYLHDRQDLPRVLDLPDAFSLYWKRRKAIKRNWLSRLFDHVESGRVLAYEKILHQFNLGLVCSVEDLNFLKTEHQTEHLRILPNGVNLETFDIKAGHDYQNHLNLLFTGNMDYAPNVDAVQYFVKDIFPLIQAKYPSAHFTIAGQRPLPKVKELASEHVSVTGFIADLADVYREASIVVAPLRFGAGTQNKVLEAMAMGVPVVCSNVGFEGLGIQNGEGAFMETSTEGFAQRVLSLMDSQSIRQATGQQGHQVMRDRFSWQGVAQLLEGYFEEVKH